MIGADHGISRSWFPFAARGNLTEIERPFLKSGRCDWSLATFPSRQVLGLLPPLLLILYHSHLSKSTSSIYRGRPQGWSFTYPLRSWRYGSRLWTLKMLAVASHQVMPLQSWQRAGNQDSFLLAWVDHEAFSWTVQADSSWFSKELGSLTCDWQMAMGRVFLWQNAQSWFAMRKWVWMRHCSRKH